MAEIATSQEDRRRGDGNRRVRDDDQERLEGFGAFIRERRRALGLTQTQLADRLGWLQERVSLIENAKYGMPSLPAIERMAPLLDVTMAQLLRQAGYDLEHSESDVQSAAVSLVLHKLSTIEADDLEGSLQQVADLLHDALGAEKFDAFVLEPEGRGLRALGVSDTPLGRLEREVGLDWLPLDHAGTVGRTFFSGEPFLSPDIQDDPDANPDVLGRLGVRSTLEAPVTRRDTVRGVLAATSRQVDRFDRQDLTFLVTVAGLTGAIMELAELRATRVRELTEVREVLASLLEAVAERRTDGVDRAQALLDTIDAELAGGDSQRIT